MYNYTPFVKAYSWLIVCHSDAIHSTDSHVCGIVLEECHLPLLRQTTESHLVRKAINKNTHKTPLTII